MGNNASDGCATSVIIMVGFRIIGWKVTVISSNFIALMLILNIMNIHVTVRFLQIKKEQPELTKVAVLISCKKMMMPILYTVLTTICAFLSLFSVKLNRSLILV